MFEIMGREKTFSDSLTFHKKYSNYPPPMISDYNKEMFEAFQRNMHTVNNTREIMNYQS